MRRLLLWCCVLSACAPETPKLGGLDLVTTESSFAVRSGEATLLESATSAAPVATRVGKARYEMQYGSWRITDNTSGWTEGRRFHWDQVTGQRAEGTWKTADDVPVMTVTAVSQAMGTVALGFKASDPATNRLSLAFRCEDADRFLGFGEQADAVDHHGHTIALWTSEPGIGKRMEDDETPDLWFLQGTRHASSFGLPVWMSNRGYQGVVGSDARSVFEVCSKQSDVFRVEVWANEATLFLFAGTPTQALALSTSTLLGHPMRPPPLAFAPWNDAIYGPDEVRRVARVLRENHIPSAAIWTEDFRGGTQSATDYRLTEEWDVDRTLYPDPEGLAAELSDAGFSWQAYFNTFVVKDTRVYAEAVDGGHLVGSADGGAYLFSGVTFTPTGLADLSRPATREWVKGYLRRALDVGFTGWMADYGEWLPHDAVLASGEDPLQAHNRYAREWALLNAEVLAERDDDTQRLFFARAGWLGSNAITPVVWAGDQRTDFEPDDGLPTVVPMGINLGLAGVSTFAHDIAGYQSKTNPNSTKELFFRWTELGALTPVMRTHHGIDPTHNWHFDSDAETLAHYARWARFHLQLYPYLDASAAEAEAAGTPLMRSLVFAAPNDPRAWTVSDEYLLGGALLVAPVLTQGATSRTVYLPAGDWVSWDGATSVSGPGEVTVDAPVSELPLFVRRGTCVPRLPERVETVLPAGPGVVTLEQVWNERSLYLVTGGASRFVERDGTGYEVETASGTDFAEGGAALTDCVGAERGCVDRSGAHPVVRMTGSSALSFPGGTLTITGPARTIDVEVVQPR